MTPGLSSELQSNKSGRSLDCTYPTPSPGDSPTATLLAFSEWHCSSSKPDPRNPPETLSPTQASSLLSSPQAWCSPWPSCPVSFATVFQLDWQLSFFASPNFPTNRSQRNLSYIQHNDVSVVIKTWQGLPPPTAFLSTNEKLDYRVCHIGLYDLFLSTIPAEWSCLVWRAQTFARPWTFPCLAA